MHVEHVLFCRRILIQPEPIHRDRAEFLVKFANRQAAEISFNRGCRRAHDGPFWCRSIDDYTAGRRKSPWSYVMTEPVQGQSGWQLFAFGSAFFAALTAIFGKVGVAEINSNFAVLIRTVVVVLMTAGIVFVRKEFEPLGQVSRLGLAMLVLSALATGMSWLCYYRALQMAPASLVAPIDKLSVAVVIVLAAIFLGEALTLKTVIGGGLVVAGAVVLAWE